MLWFNLVGFSGPGLGQQGVAPSFSFLSTGITFTYNPWIQVRGAEHPFNKYRPEPPDLLFYKYGAATHNISETNQKTQVYLSGS